MGHHEAALHLAARHICVPLAGEQGWGWVAVLGTAETRAGGAAARAPGLLAAPTPPSADHTLLSPRCPGTCRAQSRRCAADFCPSTSWCAAAAHHPSHTPLPVLQATPKADTALLFFETNQLGFTPEMLGRIRCACGQVGCCSLCGAPHVLSLFVRSGADAPR